MKCSELPTTSTAESAVKRSPHEAAVAFETLLFAQTLKPLSQSLGFYGDAALDACAGSFARHEHGDFADRLERLFSLGANV
jgi:hypothetical protein